MHRLNWHICPLSKIVISAAYTVTSFARMLKVPCFPSSKAKVVAPEDTVQYKNVHRYGETTVRQVNARPLRQEQWKKSARQGYMDPNAGRILPDPPAQNHTYHDEPRKLRHKPRADLVESQSLTMSSASMPRQHAPSRKQQKAPISSDFYVSVPIFTETLDHSYRKKNEYVYRDDPDDSSSVFHQSLSRAESLRELNESGGRRSRSGHRRGKGSQQGSQHGSPHSSIRYTETTRKDVTRREVERPSQRSARSATRLGSASKMGSHQKRRPLSGSEASFATNTSRGTTYSYESEHFDPAMKLKHKPLNRSRASIDSDENDLR